MLNSIYQNPEDNKNVSNTSRQNFNAQNRLQYNPPSMQGAEEIKAKVQNVTSDNFVGKAVSADKPLGTLTYIKNFALCILMSLGFTHGTNWLISSKQMSNQTTNIGDFANTRMYKIGTWADKNIAGNPIGKAIGSGITKIKTLLSKIPVPQFMREIGSKIKMGTRSQWDKTGVFTLGKGAEAMNEAVEFLSKVPKNEISKLGLSAANEKKILDLLRQYNAGAKTGDVVYKEIGPILNKVSSSKLAQLSTGKLGYLDTIFRTKPNINMALHKAKFFNSSFNKAQGPIGKGLQKLMSLVGEASGGGVLGGGTALLMNAVGLMTGFNAASEAEKGDKLSAFMEDYIGYTLGGYLMNYVMAKGMHKALGVAELGMDPAAIQAVGKKLGVDTSTGRLNDVVIAYNRMFKKSSTLEEVISGLKSGKISVDKAMGKIQKFNIENITAQTSKDGLIKALEKEMQSGKKVSELLSISNEIKAAYKSKLTFKSIFNSADKFNKGNFFQRLGRYITQKPLSIFGKIASTGKYDLFTNGRFTIGNRVFCQNGSKVVTSLKFLKRLGGGLGRMAFVLFVLTPPCQKFFSKISHMIFGKPKKSRLDENNPKNANAKNSKDKMQKLFAPVNPDGTNALGLTQKEMAILKQKGLKDEEILQFALYKQEYMKQAKQMQEINNTKPLASKSLLKESMIPAQKGYPNSSAPRNYVPSSKSKIKIQNAMPDELKKAFMNADRSEEYANAVLGG